MKVSWALSMDEKGRPIVNPEAYYDQDPISIYPDRRRRAQLVADVLQSQHRTGLHSGVLLGVPYQAQAELKPGTTGYVRPSGADQDRSKPSIGPEPPEGVRGGLQAWDPVNQKLEWHVDGGGGIGGGTATTAGNLVFQMINDGRFRAVSADKGEILYEVQTGRTGMAPPITYEVDGKQYVAFGGGLGRAATVVGPNNAKIDNPPMHVRVRAGREGGDADTGSAASSRSSGGSCRSGARTEELVL